MITKFREKVLTINLICMKRSEIYLVMMLYCIMFFSCHKSENYIEDSRTHFDLIQGNNLRSLGMGKILNIDEENGVASLTLSHNTKAYTIHITDEISRKCVDYLKKAKEDNIPLSIKAIGESSEIGNVSELTNQEMDEYMKKYGPNIGSRAMPPATEYSSEDARWAMIEVSLHLDGDSPINFAYAGDGCFARAHWFCKVLQEKGYDVGKFFIAAPSLRARFYSCCTHWKWHVVPALCHRVGSDEYWIIDPVMSDLEPWGKYEFIFKCTDKNCGTATNAFAVWYEFTNWSQYKIGGEYDNSLHDTYFVLGVMWSLQGCGPMPDIPCITCKE